MLLLIVQLMLTFVKIIIIIFFFVTLRFEFTFDGWECGLKLTLKFRGVCGRHIAPTPGVITLPF